MMEKSLLAPPQATQRNPTGSRWNTRSILKWALSYILVQWLVLDIAFAGSLSPAFPLSGLYRRQGTGVAKILLNHPLLDGHVDLLILIREIYGNQIYGSNFSELFENGGMAGHVDAPRIDQGLVGGAFWSAWVPCPADGFDFSDANYAPFVKATLEQIDLYNRIAEKYPKYFTLARTAKEAETNFHRRGKLISPLAIEGLHQIGNSLATLRLYHALGVRYATLTWNCHNIFADAAVVSVDGEDMASKPYHGGISKAGQDLILEMNRLGMIVDLSHVSVDTMRDVLGGSASTKNWNGSIAPPIFSHSSAKSLCPHPRNVPDDILHLVKKRGSVVMVNFAPDFISCKSSNSTTGLPDFVHETNTIEHVVDHITYIGDLIGYDHVGLGSDFDGIPNVPRGLDDFSKYPDLIQLLLDRGVSEKDVVKVAGGNVLRVWHEVDKVAARLQKEMNPVEDDLSHGGMGGMEVMAQDVLG
ncbi:Peptidase M19 family [Teratosphaeria destructans]|uniref:Dipeptidase n=1 Tax=Teratosphaeria destructans TaxID=418781 RepID=A0A9W7SKE4_9PEZI|nr:Peptidase M19 family [Teratosphaeria destructans]